MANAANAGGSASDSDRIKQELAGDAERLKNTARDQAEHRLQEGERQAAQTARSTSSAIDRAADELRRDENAPDWLASAFASAARQVSALADQFYNTSPEEIARRTSDFARHNPAAFLTASAALGFAAARFLRAGAEYRHDEDTGSPGGERFAGGQGAASSTQATGGGTGAGASTYPTGGGATTDPGGGATTYTGGASSGGTGATTSTGATTVPSGDPMGERT